MKYQKLAKEILENIGGTENLSNVEHCATRLRLHFKNQNIVKLDEIRALEGIPAVVEKKGHIQVIIGPDVRIAYMDFLEVSGFQMQENRKEVVAVSEKGFKYYINQLGDICATVFMPIVPALATGGLILAIKNLLVNYFGMSADGGTATILLAIFSAGFSFLPVYIGYTLSRCLKMDPIMGAFLGALLISPSISGVEGLSFLGISIPTVSYESSVLPIVLGVILMYFVDKILNKIIPETVKHFMKPLLTMVVVTPITLIALGPIGTVLSTYVGNLMVAMMDTIGALAMPILAALYPYMVMLGLDKAAMAIGFDMVAKIGYDPLVVVIGYISNLCIGGTALAVAMSQKNDKSKRGLITSFGMTALCGVTEPAFYGALIMRPHVLIGTAIGAVSAGLVAGIFELKSFVEGGCPGLLTAMFFLPAKGSSMFNMILAVIVALIAIVVSFVSTTIIISKVER